MTRVTDEILLDNLKKGDINSLGLLYARYKTLLFNYFLRTTGNYHLSNDLLMETFERVYKYRHSYKISKKVRPWLYQIAANLCKDYFRKTTSVAITNEMNLEAVKSTVEDVNDKTYKNQQLLSALNKLKPPERNIITMYYLLEMSYKDIAANENITVNNARIKVCRALKKLKDIAKEFEL